MDTRDTVVRVHGMSRCAKYQNRTRTRGTCDPITTGIPVPVTNPSPISHKTVSLWDVTMELILSIQIVPQFTVE